MNYSRRQFQLITITAALSTAMTAMSIDCRAGKPPKQLKRRNVLLGLKRGLQYNGPVNEVLKHIQTYSMEQTLLGGCVFRLASRLPADIVHILVKADPQKAAKGILDMEIEGMESINGNSMIFTFKNQRFFIEHLDENLYKKRLSNLIPGSEENDFYNEFAHQLVTYNIQTKKSKDPSQAIGKSSTIKLKRVSRQKSAASVLKTMVESKRLGLELPKDELRRIKNSLQLGLGEDEDPLQATALFLSQTSHFTHYHEHRENRQIMNSQLAKDTLGKVLGCDINKLNRTFYKIERKAPRGTPHSELWLCAIRCLEDTSEINCHETLYFLRKNYSGHQLLCCNKDHSNSSQLLQIKSIKRLHTKQQKRNRR